MSYPTNAEILKEINRITDNEYSSVSAALKELGMARSIFYRKLKKGYSVYRIFNSNTIKKDRWSNNELTYLYANAGKEEVYTIAKTLNKTVGAVRKKCIRMNLKVKNSPRYVPTDAQVRLLLILLKNDITYEEIQKTILPQYTVEDIKFKVEDYVEEKTKQLRIL